MKILLIEGPLLDKIGEREPEIYGGKGTREKLISAFNEKAAALGVETEAVSEYCEGALAKIIVNAKCDGIIINPGAYTHTSVLLRDALLCSKIPFVEAHISNVFEREEFRRKSYLSDIAVKVVYGLGPVTYSAALESLVAFLKAN
ncbi:type II 3-dehydroquinate dehydratase [bacterium]|nr:type II 3-dehydroquinate dehydratase [bacterium]MBQ4438448.1 type II 3-dehydroquinate dehydratase [bacterium]